MADDLPRQPGHELPEQFRFLDLDKKKVAESNRIAAQLCRATYFDYDREGKVTQSCLNSVRQFNKEFIPLLPQKVHPLFEEKPKPEDPHATISDREINLLNPGKVDLTQFFAIQAKVRTGCNGQFPAGSGEWQGCIVGHQEYVAQLMDKGGYFRRFRRPKTS